MPGVRDVVLAGSALAVTGGVALVLWSLLKTKKTEESQESAQLSVRAKHGELRTTVDELITAERPTPAASTPPAARPRVGLYSLYLTS